MDLLDSVDFPEIHWILVSSVVVLSLIWWLAGSQKSGRPTNCPPYPTPPSFIFGHLLKLAGDSRQTTRKWRQKVGDIYSLDFRGKHYIVINGYDKFKDVLVHHADHVPDAPPSFLTRILKEDNKGIAESRGDNWREQRKVSLSILREFGLGKNVLAERIQREVSIYTDTLVSYNGCPVDVRLPTTVSISNIICAIVVGQRFEYDDPDFLELIGHMTNAAKYLIWLPLLTFFPFLYYLPGDLFYAKRLVSSFTEINSSFSQAHIHLVKSQRQTAPDNFIAAYLDKMSRKLQGQEQTQMDEANLVAVIRNLFIAGTDTTSAIILWCLLYMLHHPDTQEKVYLEIKSQVGDARPVSIHDKPRLPFLNAVVMETQRHSSITPFATPREVITTFETHGFTFPKGSVVMPNIDSILHDERVWQDPHVFRPERFLDKDGHLLQPEQFIPFSIGRRVCLGESLAKMELFLFISMILQRFKLEPEVEGELPPLKEVYGAICSPQDFRIRFVARCQDGGVTSHV